MLNQQQCWTVFRRFQQHQPQPTTELRYHTPFELLVAVILSAQATDISVNRATAVLFPIANTPAALLSLGVEGLAIYIRSIGLYRTKAKHIIQSCKQLLIEHQGEVPASRRALEALPGVGRKTANVLLNTVFGWPTIAVDTHIFRVSNRLGLAPGKTVHQVEQQLLAVVPDQFKQHCHHWLVLHGRYTCTARKPRCRHCIIADLCEYPSKCL
jgi:endonuclease-3